MIIYVQTDQRTQLKDITDKVKENLKSLGEKNGLVHIFSMHTTAAVTINENADPEVAGDIIRAIDRLVPFEADYRHMEGNSAAHIKTSLFGQSETVVLKDGQLVLGTWQGIYFCEFDGPRSRKVHLKVIPDKS